ncbi:hypothetical protein FACS1894217_09470 [Clostridia bacterium]|nr:hypothetical protein FACS1894217_09470 [Clostridia bacterium]
MTTATAKYELFEQLDDESLELVLRFARGILKKKREEDFDYFSPESLSRIKAAEDAYERGEFTRFNSADELAAHFGFTLEQLERIDN